MAQEIIGTRNGQQYFVGSNSPAVSTPPAPSSPGPGQQGYQTPGSPTPPPPAAGPATYVGSDGNTYKTGTVTQVNSAQGSAAPLPPKSSQDYASQVETSSGVQRLIDSVNANFASQISTEQQAGAGREAETRSQEVARGLVGSPQSEGDITTTKDYNAKQVAAIQDKQSLAIAQILDNADTRAETMRTNDLNQYNTDYTNWKAQQDKTTSEAKTDFSSLAKAATSATWEDFAKASPDAANQLLNQTGYDPAVAPFLWNSQRDAAHQIVYDSAPVTNPDGTLMVIGHDPTKTGPDSIIRTKIDTAPEGMTTTIVGGLPYWKDNTTGSLFPVPSDKGQMITLKDSNGTNYLYNTYTKQFINPLGADTSGGGTVNPNAPASPLSDGSTLGDLLSYYTSGGNTQPGAGYTGAILAALGPGVTLNSKLGDLKARIPDIMAGIIKAEGSPVLDSQYNNGAAIMWSTAQAYGMDQQFKATPVQLKGSDGQMHSYASFPDKQSGTQALQSYLTSLISGPQSAGQGQLDPKIANSGLGTTADKWEAQGIMSGTQPPFNPTTGSISKSKGNVMAILSKAGFDTTKAWQQYQATTKFISSANSTQQLRMKQAETSVKNSLGNLSSLVNTLNTDGAITGFKFVNKGSLTAAVNGLYGQKTASDAQAVVGQLALITDELGQTFMGGNSPTDSAFDLAKGVLSGDFTYDQFNTQIDLIKTNLGYREQSWSSVGAVGADGQPVDNSGGAPAAASGSVDGFDYTINP